MWILPRLFDQICFSALPTKHVALHFVNSLPWFVASWLLFRREEVQPAGCVFREVRSIPSRNDAMTPPRGYP